jgi:hypothetical protein
VSFRDYRTAIAIVITSLSTLPLLAQQPNPHHLRAALHMPIPESLFSLHIDHPEKNWPTVPFGGWRLIDNYVVWADLQPQKGQWNFKNLDAALALAESRNVPVLLTLGLSPTWASARPQESKAFRPGSTAEPRDIRDWQEYVRGLATHYKGRIHYWEMWNEPNLRDFYTGDVSKIVELAREAYRILKEVDPTNVLTTPSPTGGLNGAQWLDDYFRRGGAQYMDVVAFHFYVSPGEPEKIVPIAQRVAEVMAKYHVLQKPLWSTETGWFIENHKTYVKPGTGSFSKVLNDETSAAFVARTYIILWLSGVSRFYWYGWDNHFMGLTEEDGTPKPGGVAFGEIQKWLVGARLEGCDTDASDTWVCEINRDGDYKGHIVWNQEASTTFPIPANWSVRNERDLAGGTHAVAGTTRSLQVGVTPILLENKAP